MQGLLFCTDLGENISLKIKIVLTLSTILTMKDTNHHEKLLYAILTSSLFLKCMAKCLRMIFRSILTREFNQDGL